MCFTICSIYVFQSHRASKKSHSIKASQTVVKAVKPFQHPPGECSSIRVFLLTNIFIIPSISPIDRNILGKSPLRPGCLYAKTTRFKVRPSRAFAVGLHSGGCPVGKGVGKAYQWIACWHVKTAPAGWMVLLSLNRMQLVLCWNYKINRNNIIINFSHKVSKIWLKSELCEQCHLDSFSDLFISSSQPHIK